GVADAKGGLAVMLIALQAFEQCPWSKNIGWEILINPDEEIGSPGSSELLRQCATSNHVGMVYEPAFADGAIVSQRKGSGNFDLVVRGRAAHAGRDFAQGRNALTAAATAAIALDHLNQSIPNVTINIA